MNQAQIVTEKVDSFINILNENSPGKMINELVCIFDYAKLEMAKGNLNQNFKSQFIAEFNDKMKKNNIIVPNFVNDKILDVFTGQYEKKINPDALAKKDKLIEEIAKKANVEAVKVALKDFSVTQYSDDFVKEYRNSTTGAAYLLVAENFITDIKTKLSSLKTNDNPQYNSTIYGETINLKREFVSNVTEQLNELKPQTLREVQDSITAILSGVDHFLMPSIKDKIQSKRSHLLDETSSNSNKLN